MEKKPKKPVNRTFDQELAKVIAKAVKQGKFKLEGIEKAIFMAGQLSAPLKMPK